MSEETLETDYLVIGAGAAGMAFADSLLTHSDAILTIVDRRHAPGGHWIDAYPFVRLHQPSAFYGVSSVPLGQDVLDVVGPNSGYYELAGPDELRAYFAKVMQRRFLPSGRVRYFPGCEYLGEGRFVSRLAQVSWNVRVRRKVVDTTYLEGTIPATSAPPFEVADGVRCVPAGEIVHIVEQPERFVVIGSGKTALDTCVWLLEQNVPASSICWIKPREAWWLNRRFQQPLALLPDSYRGTAIQLEAMAQAASIEDLFARLEAEKLFLRVDAGVAPTMFRGAVISEAELALLRNDRGCRSSRSRAQDRARRDRSRQGSRAYKLKRQCISIARREGWHVVPCGRFLRLGRVTVQPFLWGFACYQFAMLGVVEALVGNDEEKNRLCPPIAYWDSNTDYLSAFLATLANERARMAYPALANWAKETRLNPFGGIGHYRDAPDVVDARARIKRFAMAAVGNLAQLVKSNTGRAGVR